MRQIEHPLEIGVVGLGDGLAAGETSHRVHHDIKFAKLSNHAFDHRFGPGRRGDFRWKRGKRGAILLAGVCLRTVDIKRF